MFLNGVEIAQLGKAVGWITEESWFDSSLLHGFQTVFGAQLRSCAMGTRVSFSRGKVAGGMELTTNLQQVPELKMCGALPPYLHAVVLK